MPRIETPCTGKGPRTATSDLTSKDRACQGRQKRMGHRVAWGRIHAGRRARQVLAAFAGRRTDTGSHARNVDRMKTLFPLMWSPRGALFRLPARARRRNRGRRATSGARRVARAGRVLQRAMRDPARGRVAQTDPKR